MRGVVSYAPRSKLASSSSGGKDSTSIGAYWRSQKRPRRRSLRGEADDARPAVLNAVETHLGGARFAPSGGNSSVPFLFD